ncbi:MAG TPA: acyl-CoA reductase [Microscillaceae bacterium]|jgi:hypothetical protein|nr:acyl-CoA reductase [Microscillaceae bacterium]
MSFTQVFNAFIQLGKHLKETNGADASLLQKVYAENPWFTHQNVELALQGIAHYLQEDTLHEIAKEYKLSENWAKTPQRVGILAAGNIPGVGFHDLLCVLLSGHLAYVKLSSQDQTLMQYLIQTWSQYLPSPTDSPITLTGSMREVEALIATGSDNTAQHFAYYFKDKPCIIRSNRTSCAVLNGRETASELQALGKDIFQYFGMGCRSVSKLFVPQGYDFTPLLDELSSWQDLLNHTKYANNYHYQRAVLLVNQLPHWDNGIVLLREEQALASPTGVIHFELYKDMADLQAKISLQSSKIQCMVAQQAWFPQSLPFGTAQMPNFLDFADGVDTLVFLQSL